MRAQTENATMLVVAIIIGFLVGEAHGRFQARAESAEQLAACRGEPGIGFLLVPGLDEQGSSLPPCSRPPDLAPTPFGG